MRSRLFKKTSDNKGTVTEVSYNENKISRNEGASSHNENILISYLLKIQTLQDIEGGITSSSSSVNITESVDTPLLSEIINDGFNPIDGRRIWNAAS